MNGRGPKAKVDFKSLVDQGIIDQETYEKIENYLKNNTPEMPANGQAPAEGSASNEQTEDGQAPAEGTTPPEMPEGTTPPELPASGEAPAQDDLLTKLVEAGILTQEQADAIAALEKTAGTAAAAAEEAVTEEEKSINQDSTAG